MKNITGNKPMYDSDTLNDLVTDYMKHCNNEPTRQGLADWLGVSHQTISNIINGTFNGYCYTTTPHVNRIVDNKDFWIVRSLFAKSYV